MGHGRATTGGIAGAAALLACAAIAIGAPAAQAARIVHPRMGAALGIVPAHGAQFEIATGKSFPVVYHGGSVMHNVTVHTIFWAPPGYSFTGSPGGGVPGYIQLIERFFSDTAGASGATSNVFSVLNSYPDGNGPAGYHIAYSPAADAVYDTGSYPPTSQQCASPNGVATCVTDLQVQKEVDRVAGSVPASMNDVWFVFLPPDVDECISPGNCGTNTFGGYHSFGDVGHGARVYVAVPDPLIEFTPPPGGDPQGNAEAETAIVTAAHELVESMTDPTGVGWMDPNGFEVADKCETGPQIGTPLGYAANGSPYNQLIGGDPWLLQSMWSNPVSGCVLSSTSVVSQPGLPTVWLRQFSSQISGYIGYARGGVSVDVALQRANRIVAVAAARTRSSGRWGPVSLGNHAVGDDRDQLLILYGKGGPATAVIATGDGGNPYTESGFTGWFDLDHGYRVTRSAITLSPCGQTGVLGLTVGGVQTPSPLERCSTEANQTTVHTGEIHEGTKLTMSSTDNRAPSPLAPNGGLVSMTVPLGEPGAVSAVGNSQLLFTPSGFPTCSADLEAQSVSCQGLVPGAHYTLSRRRSRLVRRAVASRFGKLTTTRLAISGGDAVSLRNRAGRVLSVLHVARLRVNVNGRQTVIASGRCQAGDFWGPPPGSPPLNGGVGQGGLEDTGRICPPNGRAAGLPSAAIEQTDDFSGGTTRTEVPQLVGFSPSAGATLYGRFVAWARAGVPGPHHSVLGIPGGRVSVTITPRGSGRAVFSAANVASGQGRPVASLKPGIYSARWVVRDAVGDTRTVTSVFIEQ